MGVGIVMRVVINAGGLFVTLSIVILIHLAIISQNVRDMEVHNNLEASADYAMDKMTELYKEIENEGFNDEDHELYSQQLITCFCDALNSMMTTDGELVVSVHQLDIENAKFDFWVEEVYEYGFMGRKGQTSCRRLVELH